MVINDERAETLGNAHISGIMRRSQYALLSFLSQKTGGAREAERDQDQVLEIVRFRFRDSGRIRTIGNDVRHTPFPIT
jgi:hypothetical protein